MASLRSILLVALLGAVSLQAQTSFTDFTYSYSYWPHPNYPDSGNELNDGIASVPAWGNAEWTGVPEQTEPYVGLQWIGGSIRFDFNSTVTVHSASFYFAESGAEAGVSFPQRLRLKNDSGSVDLVRDTAFWANSGMAAPFTFELGDTTTDHLILDITLFGEWGMMTEATFTASAIPEPSTYAAIAGVAMLSFAIWRRRRAMT